MDVEAISALDRRARIHGALADATRLRIVDLLAAGDAASSELGAEMGTPSNLLAHHLRVLESAGLVERQRSEGDGRRSYWRLLPHALDAISAPALGTPERIVFVCTANSARSHLAAALWRETSDVPVASAGTHPAERVHPGTVATARRHHLTLTAVRPERLTDVAADGDLVVTVCDRAHEELRGVARLHWSIPDPVPAGTTSAFDLAYDQLASKVRRLAPLLDRAS